VVSNGYNSECSAPYWSNPSLLIFWHSGTLALSPRRQSARMSKNSKGWVRPVWRWTLWLTHFCHNQKKCGTERVKTSVFHATTTRLLLLNIITRAKQLEREGVLFCSCHIFKCYTANECLGLLNGLLRKEYHMLRPALTFKISLGHFWPILP